MARVRDVVRRLTGFIGYANYPRPDIERPANRLMRAVNVWMGGTAGIGQRRRGMTLRYSTTDAITSFVTVPVQADTRVYTAPILLGADGFKTAAPAYLDNPVTWGISVPAFVHASTLNRKAYLTPSAVSALRLRVVNTSLLAYPAPAAPTAANTGAGAYAATTRYYVVQWLSGDVYNTRGPVGAVRTFTPSGAGTGVVVTMPTSPAPTQNPAKWILWGSADGLTYYRLATQLVSATTYTDTTNPASYSTVTGEVLEDPLWSYPVRAAGMEAAGAVASVANTGAGAYAATLRYYRVRWVERIGGVVTRRGEPGASTSFTPSGGGTAARVTQPTYTTTLTTSYVATHWELEVSLDDVNWYLLATVPLATTTYDDSTATASYSSGTVSDTIGDFTAPPLCRSILVDRDRVLFAGGFTENLSRVWFTPVLGTLNVGDDERVPTDNYFDIEASDDDEITAMAGPIGGAILVFKRRSLFRLVRTGVEATPYEIIKITDGIGVETPTAVCLGPNTTRFECVYFVNQHGAYRYSADGLECLSTDLAPEWRGSLSSTGKVLYYPTRHVVLFGSLAYHVGTGGWSLMSWGSGNVDLMNMARIDPSLYGTNDMPLLMASTTTGIYQADAPATITDVASAAFLAEIRTNRFSLSQPTQQWRPVRLRLWGTSDDMVTVETWTDTNLVTPVTTGDVSLGSDSDEQDLSSLLRPGPIEFLGISVRDATATADRDDWTLDAIEVTGIPQESIP